MKIVFALLLALAVVNAVQLNSKNRHTKEVTTRNSDTISKVSKSEVQANATHTKAKAKKVSVSLYDALLDSGAITTKQTKRNGKKRASPMGVAVLEQKAKSQSKSKAKKAKKAKSGVSLFDALAKSASKKAITTEQIARNGKNRASPNVPVHLEQKAKTKSKTLFQALADIGLDDAAKKDDNDDESDQYENDSDIALMLQANANKLKATSLFQALASSLSNRPVTNDALNKHPEPPKKSGPQMFAPKIEGKLPEKSVNAVPQASKKMKYSPKIVASATKHATPTPNAKFDADAFRASKAVDAEEVADLTPVFKGAHGKIDVIEV